MKVASVVMNCALPLDDRLIEVKVWPYKVNGKGSATVVTVVIPVIANVGGARHNASAYLNYRKTCAGYRRWGRRSRRGRRWAGCRRRRWRRQRDIPSGLNTNKGRRAGLKVAYHRVGWIGRLIGIEPEVIERAEANGVGVLILRKCFRVPGDRACVLGNSPWRAAVSLAVKGAIICPAGMLNRRMKSDVRDVYSWPNRHAERLDRAIEVLVVESIFIVPDASGGVRHFVAHEPDTVSSGMRVATWFTVAPVQAVIAGCSRTVAPAPVKLKG